MALVEVSIYSFEIELEKTGEANVSSYSSRIKEESVKVDRVSRCM